MRMWFGGLLMGMGIGMWLERALVWNSARLRRKLERPVDAEANEK